MNSISLHQQFREAFLKKDIDGMVNLMDDEIEFTGLKGTVTGKEVVRQRLTDAIDQSSSIKEYSVPTELSENESKAELKAKKAMFTVVLEETILCKNGKIVSIKRSKK